MIRRAPSWMWFALVAVAIIIFIVGLVTTLSSNGKARATKPAEKAAPAAQLTVTDKSVRFRIELHGIDQEVPAIGKQTCWFYNPTFMGPADEAPLVLYVFEDGTETPVFDSSGNRLPAPNKSLRGFKGPEGRTLTVVVTPPGPGEGTESCRKYLER